MNFSSKDANNTVYLEEVAVSHTKQFFGNKKPERKKNSHFDSDCTWTVRSLGKLMVFDSGFDSKINL